MKSTPKSLEQVLENNALEAVRFRERADALLDENGRIETELARILSEPPRSSVTPSRLVAAFANATTELPAPPKAARMDTVRSAEDARTHGVTHPERVVVFAAVAMVRSWRARHKKNWQIQERQLAAAVDNLEWEK